MGAIPFILFAGNCNVLEGFASTQGIIKMTKGSGITAIGLAAMLPAEFFLTASGLATFRASRKSKRRSHRGCAFCSTLPEYQLRANSLPKLMIGLTSEICGLEKSWRERG
jgi:hypothetical protein